MGASDPSPVSESMCATTTCRPMMNPVDVRASATQSVPLLIQWDVRIRFICCAFESFICNDRVCRQ